MHRAIKTFLLAAALSIFPVLSHSQDDLRISEMSKLDLGYMQQQRDLIGTLVASEYGRRFQQVKPNDLELLQRILDDELVGPDQTRELQAMGVVMGDLLANELDLHWVIYEDRLGRSRALRYRETDAYLFPMTMIARRHEAGNTESVEDIYARAEAAMRSAMPPLPYH
ncbi:DUF3806 domain-containing protein [Halioglobus maricola]|uniref:DUF3806 domain-containing protein n=1 Tax=Halioglobus maricola TaxID=2601894 RepID=A0A5P9NGL4_9GAMM|nr:DUF3806 domain-containing protein [Halioglobus maricola]QFU74921.1 DUF3806 domain-containing protein [Halioglobus maricola]